MSGQVLFPTGPLSPDVSRSADMRSRHVWRNARPELDCKACGADSIAPIRGIEWGKATQELKPQTPPHGNGGMPRVGDYYMIVYWFLYNTRCLFSYGIYHPSYYYLSKAFDQIISRNKYGTLQFCRYKFLKLPFWDSQSMCSLTRTVLS